jgi:hypothetical protein
LLRLLGVEVWVVLQEVGGLLELRLLEGEVILEMLVSELLFGAVVLGQHAAG